MFNKKYNTLISELAAMKEDMKTLIFAGEEEASHELFIRETRRLLGKRPELPADFKQRSAAELLKDLNLG